MCQAADTSVLLLAQQGTKIETADHTWTSTDMLRMMQVSGEAVLFVFIFVLFFFIAYVE